MYCIYENVPDGARRLSHSEDVFTEALKYGEEYYYVENTYGRSYGLKYIKNNDLVPENYRRLKNGVEIYPVYEKYDENDLEKIDLSLLIRSEGLAFDSINEYSMVIAKLVLKHTDLKVYFLDSFAKYFFEESDRLQIVEALSEIESTDILHVEDGFQSGIFGNDFKRISVMPLFHTLFFWQSLTNLRLSNVKYVGITLTGNEGIGGILSYYSNACNMFEEKRWTVFLRDENLRYSKEILSKYFDFNWQPQDADDENTIYVSDFTSLVVTYYYSCHMGGLCKNIVRDSLMEELDRDAEQLLGEGDVLGVLIRGTDYIISGMRGNRRNATVDDMIPMIHQWMKEDGYKRIFLATEDQDILERMEKEFGELICTVPQKRFRIADFKDKILLSELEKEEMKVDESIGEIMMISYFKSLYVLSKCRNFMASGQCHGWNVVTSLNNGKFERCYKFCVDKNR